jgi:hypothetical protein
MKHHSEILLEAGRILQERGREYGAPEPCFDTIAQIASAILRKSVTRYDVAVIQLATKLGRISETATKDDSWIDLVNYAAFAGQFAGERNTTTNAAASIQRAEVDVVLRSAVADALGDDGAAQIAKKFAPKGRPALSQEELANLPGAPVAVGTS